MATVSSNSLECQNELGVGLRVEFQKIDDRFVHSIYAVKEGESRPLLKSIEGTPDECSPQSPPFTELHQQGDILFLSGASKLGHCSLSIESTDGKLLFDVACRLKQKPSQLGSMYELINDDACIETDDDTQSIVQDDQLNIFPSLGDEIKYPTTIQWQYKLWIG